MVQKNGYDIRIESFVTTGDSTLDFDEDKTAEVTGAYGYTATVIGGAVTHRCARLVLNFIGRHKEYNMQGTRASLEVVGVNSDPRPNRPVI